MTSLGTGRSLLLILPLVVLISEPMRNPESAEFKAFIKTGISYLPWVAMDILDFLDEIHQIMAVSIIPRHGDCISERRHRAKCRISE